jgi:predicted Zn-dependent protease
MHRIVLLPATLALSLMVPLTACQTIDKAERVAADTILPVSEENKLGKQMAEEVEKQAKLVKDKDIQSYVSSLGGKLAAKAKDKPKGITFTFKVIDDDKTVNAFALPGGHIYVYSGLMKLASDEAELASVLSHEMAHVTRRHIAQRLVTQYGLSTVLSLALGKDPGLVEQIAGQLVATGALLKFSRDQESEADMHGLPYLVSAGYDPNGFIRFFAKLRKGEGPGALVFLQDHPLPSDRIAALQARIDLMKNAPKNRNQAEYEDIKRKLGDRVARSH